MPRTPRLPGVDPPGRATLFFPVAGDFAGLLVMLPAVVVGGGAAGAPFLRELRLFDWLHDTAVTPPTGWQRPDVLIRRWEEWQGLYLSLGLTGSWVVNRGMAWITMAVFAAAAITYLNLCQGIGILDQVFLDRDPHDAPRLAARCGVFGGWAMPIVFATVAMFLVWQRGSERRQRAGVARPLPDNRRLGQTAKAPEPA